jgi:hypothetical protein
VTAYAFGAGLVTCENMVTVTPHAYAAVLHLDRTAEERAKDRERERLLRIWSSMSRRDIRGSRKRKEAMRAMRRAAREVLAARG